jgi:hypothetical protein
MSMAATTGPTPKMSVRVVPDAATAVADVRLGQLELVVDVHQFVGELAGDTMPFAGGDTFGVDALEERESVADHDFFADPPATSSATRAWRRQQILFRHRARSV